MLRIANHFSRRLVVTTQPLSCSHSRECRPVDTNKEFRLCFYSPGRYLIPKKLPGHQNCGSWAKFIEEVSAHAWQKMVFLEQRLGHQRVDELEARLGAEGHRDCDRTI